VKRPAPWTAPAVPDLRNALRGALAGVIEHHSTALHDGGTTGVGSVVQHRRHDKLSKDLADTLDDMRREVQAVGRAHLYWVARDMVPVAVQAARTLPEWTPELALPSEAGLLCWARPAGVIPFRGFDDAPWDAAWWWRREDGMLQIQVASRLVNRQEVLAPFGVSSPLWSGTTLLVNPAVPRTAEVDGNPDASEFVKILGATWLLMNQRTVAETRQLEARPADADSTAGRPSVPTAVSMVELRRRVHKPGERSTGKGGRTYKSRWTVEGHWRQQAVGPGWSQREPRYITEYEKGATGDDVVVKTAKVHSLRR
jgi:hypothetical protein